MSSQPASPPKKLDQIKSPDSNTPSIPPTNQDTTPTPDSTQTSAPTTNDNTPSDSQSSSPKPASEDSLLNPDSQDQPPPAQAPSLEQKISDLNNQGPITTLINDQLANRIEQKIEQKLDMEINQRSKPDLTKWLMIIFGISLMAVWLAWSGRLVWQKWF